MITLIDYGLGNLKAFENIYKALNIKTSIVSKAEDLSKAERIILPGVGAFDWAMRKLNESGMRDELTRLVCDKGIPVLGVCVGMQMLAKRSEEGELEGLGWIDADILKLRTEGLGAQLGLPHMGWNGIKIQQTCPLFEGLTSDAEFYFLHSFHFSPKSNECALATSRYTQEFVSAVNEKNIYGTQFHPEKSHMWGLKLLENFARLES